MNQYQIDKIKEILIKWNPLGEHSRQIHDLNNYNTEAIDIISNIEMLIFYFSRACTNYFQQCNKLSTDLPEQMGNFTLELMPFSLK